MSNEYRKIFGYKFEVLHNGVDRKKVKKVNLKHKIKIITYIGSVFKNAQLNSLIEITKVLKKLSEIHKISEEEIAVITSKNALAIFKF